MQLRTQSFLALAGVVCIPVLLAARPAAAPGPLTFTTPGQAVVIPFLLRNNHILVRGRVNDSDSLWFFLDTGASDQLLDLRTVQRLGLLTGEGAHVLGAGGAVQGRTVSDVRIRLPGLELRDPMVPAISLESMARQTGHACDGILGFDVFNGAVVEIDYARSTLTLHEPARFKKPVAASVIPITLKENHPYVTARATLAGGKPIAGQYVIDTGSNMALLFSSGFAQDHRVVEAMPRTLQVRLGGVGGPTMCPQGRFARLELGPYTLPGPVATIQQGGAGRVSLPDAAGNIGGDILSHFTVTFDYAHKQMFLAPGPWFDRPFEADMSGLVLSVRDDSTSALNVFLVQPQSPAAEAGIAAGDLLERIDGQAVAPGDIVDVRQRFRAEGRTFHVGLRRGGAHSEVTFTTRRLI